MKIVKLNDHKTYIKEYAMLCIKEWGNYATEDELNKKVKLKVEKINSSNYDKLLSCLLLLDNEELVGFISLFKTDGEERKDLTPWYATMFVKEKYRGLGYSKILNKVIINEAKGLGYNKVYLKSDLINYYEKFKAIYMEDLKDGEKLYYIEIN